MTGKTHLIGGIAACQAADIFLFNNDGSFGFYAAGFIGALIPDICHTHSKIGRRLPVLSKVIGSIFGHRTFTHSLLFLLLTNLLFLYFFPEQEAIRIGFLIGMISHYVLDAMTVRGIRLFYPAPLRFRIAKLRTGGKIEGFFLVCLTLFICWLYLRYQM
ncbi:metal-dependent hydrolase [Bacillus sp. Marseille-P3800]|uniref:metal-dependent hydrolase n=1 Tax=Bacillus sp. Marseille-P3800 TaxID=2014782 RepID=UPI000C06E77F|nr:metal-dependent hydrolase [Bacillus sp. Marseille-P3800]